ncbi:hypothetical protein GCM10010400_42800 [Streptomyces aculeolatus]
MDELTTREAAERLGVKPETLYAYVSRGLLSSRRAPGGRGSRFDAREVDALRRRHRRRRAPVAAAEDGGAPAGTPVRTGITLIERDRYFFRGVDATALAAAYGYEEVADWLWTGRLTPGIRFTAPPELLAAATAAAAALTAHAGPVGRLRAAAAATRCASTSPTTRSAPPPAAWSPPWPPRSPWPAARTARTPPWRTGCGRG